MPVRKRNRFFTFERSMNSPNQYVCSVPRTFRKCVHEDNGIHEPPNFISPLKGVHKKTNVMPCQNEPWTRCGLGAGCREAQGEEENSFTFALATEIDRAIDLSCRACGAMVMGARLGVPVGVSAPLRFHPQPPIRTTWRLWLTRPASNLLAWPTKALAEMLLRANIKKTKASPGREVDVAHLPPALTIEP